MASLAPSFELVAGGLRSSTASPVGGPTSLVVDRSVQLPLDLARVTLADAGDARLGDAVTLDLGLAGSPARVFTGRVVELRATLVGTTVVAVGTLQALLDLRVSAVYADRSVGAVARDLATQAGVQPGDIDAGPTLPGFAVDARRSALEQLRALAARFGLDVYADRHGHLAVQPAAGAGVGAGALGETVRYGRDVLDATGQRSASWQAVAVGGESPASTKGRSTTAWLTTDEDVARADAGSGTPRLLVVDPLMRTKDLARAAADGRLRQAGLGEQTRTVRIPGRATLDLGDDLGADALPAALPGGGGRVRWLRHRLDSVSGFTTTVGVAVAGGAPR